MLIWYTFITLTIILIIGIVWGINKGTDTSSGIAGGCGGCLVFVLAGLLITALEVVNRESDWIKLEARHAYIQELIEVSETKELSPDTVEYVNTMTRLINNQIIKHKSNYNSIWIGEFYSKEIGNLPLLKLQ